MTGRLIFRCMSQTRLRGGPLIVADDSCRVVLRGSDSDYVNASHIEYVIRNTDVDITSCRYIATQVHTVVY